jgi:phage repressor protein C with HTH and peptisase S24 domain
MYSILRVALAGEEPVNAGVLLEDPETNRLYIRMRRDWERFAPSESDFFSAVEADLTGKAAEYGATWVLKSIEESLSNILLVSDREPVEVEDFERSLGALYRKYVRSNVIEFVTHLPRYSLAVAAGKFLENREVTAEGWEEAPPELKITPEMFVARIAGRSMEPKIPDGSLCVFRYGVAGSRQGRLVLVERVGAGSNDRYTVKRYRSEKRETEEGWSHARITLEPLNPEFESWALSAEEDFRVIAEFVRVLD